MTSTSEASSTFAQLDGVAEEQRRSALGYLDLAAAHPEMRQVRAIALDLFAPVPGERLLDAGCGVGEVVSELSGLVGPGGSVVGVDLSAEAIAVACSRDVAAHVSYAVGDVTRLDFADGHFDGVRCERVLQHVADREGAIRELARVTRPGGRLCLVDTDWESLTWDGFDHVTDVLRARTFGPDFERSAGRRLRSRMVRAGLEDVRAVPVTLSFTSIASAVHVVPLFSRRGVARFASGELAERFLSSVEEADRRGEFLAALTLWVCVGTVPEV